MRFLFAAALFLVCAATTAQSGHSTRVRGLCFNADGTRMLSGDLQSTVILWDDMGRIVQTFHPPTSEYREMPRFFTRVAFYQDETYFATAGLHNVYWGDVNDAVLKEIPLDNLIMIGGDRGFLLTKDDQHLLIADGISGIQVRAAGGEKIGALLRTIPVTGAQAVYAIPGKPTEFLVQSSVEGVKHLDVSGKVIAHFPKLTGQPAIAVSPQGDAFVCGNQLYNMQGKALTKLPVSHPWDAVFAPDGQSIVLADGNNVVVSNRKGKATATIETTARVSSVAVTPDGTRIAFGTETGHVEMWTLTGRQVLEFK